ncbi:MAG TPA: hypothetical protein PLL69_00225 [Gemmatimonadales bacterium]|nr:hypothetical protein [Gemmatimonadales bacterium]
MVLPLGSVLVADLATWDAGADLQHLVLLRAQSPWAPLVLVSAGAVPAGLAFQLSLVISEAARMVIVPPANQSLLESIEQAVRLRPAPGDDAIAGYGCTRLGAGVDAAVMDALAGGNGRSLCRRLERAGAGPPGQWQRRGLVLRALSFAWRKNWSEVSIAEELDVAATTLSRACRGCFGRTWPDLIGIGTWEGVLEQGIRWHRGGRLGGFGQGVSENAMIRSASSK